MCIFAPPFTSPMFDYTMLDYRGGAMTGLEIRERQVGAIVVLDFEGDILIGAGSNMISERIKNLAEQGKFDVLLNMSGVRYVDSAGLGKLISGYTTLRREGGQVRLLGVTENVKDLLVITKLVTVFDTHEDEQQALDSFARP